MNLIPLIHSRRPGERTNAAVDIAGPNFFARRNELVARRNEVEAHLVELAQGGDKLLSRADESPVAGLAEDLLRIEGDRRANTAIRDALKGKIAEMDGSFERSADRLSHAVRSARLECVEIVRAKMRDRLAPMFGFAGGNLDPAQREALDSQLDAIVERSAAVRRENELDTYVLFLRDLGGDPAKYLLLVEVYQAEVDTLKRRAEALKKIPVDELAGATLPEPGLAMSHRQHAGKRCIANYEKPMTADEEQHEYERRLANYEALAARYKESAATPEEIGIEHPSKWLERQRKHDSEMRALAPIN